MRQRLKEVGKRAWRLLLPVVGGMVSFNLPDIIERLRANWMLATHATPPEWLTVSVLSPYIQPALVLFIAGSFMWLIWPTGFHPLRWVADQLARRKMSIVTLGLGVLCLGAGGYMTGRGLLDIIRQARPAPAATSASPAEQTKDAPQIPGTDSAPAKPAPAKPRTRRVSIKTIEPKARWRITSFAWSKPFNPSSPAAMYQLTMTAKNVGSQPGTKVVISNKLVLMLARDDMPNAQIESIFKELYSIADPSSLMGSGVSMFDPGVEMIGDIGTSEIDGALVSEVEKRSVKIYIRSYVLEG